MPLLISKESLLSSDPDWDHEMEDGSYFVTRMELPSAGDRIIIAMSGNRKFFSRLAEFGHVFAAEPVEDSQYTMDGTDFTSPEYMRQACSDENRIALMTMDGEGPTIDFIDHDGYPGEFTFKYKAVASAPDSPESHGHQPQLP
jgi:hypothetical protein